MPPHCIAMYLNFVILTSNECSTHCVHCVLHSATSSKHKTLALLVLGQPANHQTHFAIITIPISIHHHEHHDPLHYHPDHPHQ